MSWLFKTLSSVDDPGEFPPSPSPENEATGTAGVKEDLSAIGVIVGSQLQGVGSFQAPPAKTAAAANQVEDFYLPESDARSKGLLGVQNDLADIVGGISRFASIFIPFTNEPDDDEEEDDDDHVPGITDEVVQLVTEISKQPECWTEFPFRFEDGFRMSDAQREHASTIQQYIPEFATFRKRDCDSVDEEVFWLIYFIFLVPILNGHDSELLSTPEIVRARNTILQKIHNRAAESETDENSFYANSFPDVIQFSETQGHEVKSLEQDFGELKVSDRGLTGNPIHVSGNSSAVLVRFGTEDDTSFSEIENDDIEVPQRLSINKKPRNVSNDWVQLSESEGRSGWHKRDSESEDSSGWLNVDGFD